ncbi:MAG TPA: SDR family oxidoreductase [Flavisolibacter sp.]|nr:SDR family oxidoreductase [Flavisolibacter sp.]
MSTFFIVGGSSGIGQQLARQLAADGHRVIATYCNRKPVEAIQNIEYHFLDVMQEELDLSFLPGSIDGLAYLPGTIQLKPFQRLSGADFLRDYQLQCLGAVKVLQRSVSALKASGNASVVLYSTVAVQTGFPFHSMISASKGAVEGLARALAAELAPNIRVNCVAPSLVDTPLAAQILSTEEKREASAQRHPLKRVGRTEDIANISAFLLSGKSGWITGQVIHTDGGMSSLKA